MKILEIASKLNLDKGDPIDYDDIGESDLARRMILDLTLALRDGKKPIAPVASRQSFYVYWEERGVWEELARIDLKALVQLYSRDVRVVKRVESKNDLRRVYSKLKLSSAKINGICECAISNPEILDKEFFNTYETGIAFKNCFVKVSRTGIERVPHSAEHHALAALDYDFDPEAECNEWIRVLRDVFSGDKDAPDKIKALQEFTGACVAGIATDYQRCFVMVGSGENGKSTVAETISELLFPRELVTHAAPQSWDREYTLASMKSAKLNMASEIPESEIMSSAAFKTIITGDPIMARDPYGRPFSYCPQAGHLFSCNSLPGSIDSTHGFWRRFLVLEFNRDFSLEPNRATKGGIKQKLAQEVQGIMLWALHGAVRLLKQGRYTIPDSHGRALADWQANANPVAAFVQDCCIKGNGTWTSLSEIFGDFLSWTERQGRKRISNKTLAKRLRDQRIKDQRTSRGTEFNLEVLSRDRWKDWGARA